MSSKLEKFNGIDFPQWKFKLDLILEEEGLTSIVYDAKPNNFLTPDDEAAWKKKDLRARSLISRALDNSQIPRIRSSTSAKEIMERLKEDYEPTGVAASHFLYTKLFNLRMQENDSMADHLNEIYELVSKLKSIGEVISDSQVIHIILMSLPQSYSHFVTIQQGIPALTLRTLKANCLQEELKRKADSHNNGYEKAYNSHPKGRPHYKRSLYNNNNDFCTHCNIPGHNYNNCRSRHKPQQSHNFSSNNRQHNNRRYNKQRKPQQHHANSNATTHAFMLSHSTAHSTRDIWYIDSGASRHMCCRREWFHDYKPIPPITVYFGDNSTAQAIGTGTIHVTLDLPNGQKTQGRLEEVLFLPSFKKNLFSVVHATRRGVTTVLSDNNCHLEDREGNIIGLAYYNEGLCILQCTINPPLIQSNNTQALTTIQQQSAAPRQYMQLNNNNNTHNHGSTNLNTTQNTKQHNRNPYSSPNQQHFDSSFDSTRLDPTRPDSTQPDSTRLDSIRQQAREYNAAFLQPTTVHPIAANASAAGDTLDRLHQRYGHIGIERLQLFAKIHNVSIPDEHKLRFCKGCALGKQRRAPASNAIIPPATEPLQFISSDIFGPFPRSMGGAHYYCTFVDSHSRRTAVAFLKQKSDFFNQFRRFKEVTEAQLGRRIKILRFDPAGENTSNQLLEYAALEGIQVQPTPTAYPEANALSERRGGILDDMARCMLKHANLPDSFWAEAVAHACYLTNLLPTKANGMVPPEQLFSGKLPPINNIKVFGCRAYAWIPRKKRKKMDSHTTPAVYLGPTCGGHAHRLYNPQTRRIFVNRNVSFDENTLGLPDSKVKLTSCTTAESQSTPIAQPGQLAISNDIRDQEGQSLDDTIPIHGEGEIEEEEQDISYFYHNEVEEEDNSDDTSLQQQPSPPTHTTTTTTPTTPPPLKKWRNRSNSTPPPILTTKREIIPSVKLHGSEWGESYYLDKGRQSKTASKKQPRGRKNVESLSCMVASNTTSPIEPRSYTEALKSPEAEQWSVAMQEEFTALLANNTWTLVPRPEGAHVIPTMWTYKLKKNPDGSIARYKARLVARGDKQKKGIDYDEVFAPTTRLNSMRTLLTIAAAEDLEVHCLDIKNAFLNGIADRDIYLYQPPGFIDPDHPDYVCKLIKSIYGTHQAGRTWYNTLDTFLTNNDFTKCISDPCLYVRETNNEKEYVSTHVDDLLLVCPASLMHGLKQLLLQRFAITDRGELTTYLNIVFIRDREHRRIYCHQSHYTQEILATFGMQECKPITTPMQANLLLPKIERTPSEAAHIPYREAVGKLIYLATSTRPDISYAVGYLSRHMTAFNEQHWAAVKHLFRYLKGTTNYGIVLSADNLHAVEGYTDADWGREISDRKSTSGYIFRLGSSPITWMSKKQSTIALSSTEAEYIALTTGAKEALHLRHLLMQLGYQPSSATFLHEDNQSCIQLANNPVQHARTKHLDIQMQFLREQIGRKSITIKYIPTQDNIADILTKPLPRPAFEKLRPMLGVITCHPITSQSTSTLREGISRIPATL